MLDRKYQWRSSEYVNEVRSGQGRVGLGGIEGGREGGIEGGREDTH